MYVWFVSAGGAVARACVRLVRTLIQDVCMYVCMYVGVFLLQELSRELAAEKRRAAHTSRKLEQSNLTCTELRESLALAQDTVSDKGWGLRLSA